MSEEEDKLIARWETNGKKYWLNLYRSERWGYHYRSNNGGGSLGPDFDEEKTMAYMERIVADAKRYSSINMKRVEVPSDVSRSSDRTQPCQVGQASSMVPNLS